MRPHPCLQWFPIALQPKSKVLVGHGNLPISLILSPCAVPKASFLLINRGSFQPSHACSFFLQVLHSVMAPHPSPTTISKSSLSHLMCTYSRQPLLNPFGLPPNFPHLLERFACLLALCLRSGTLCAKITKTLVAFAE